MSARRAGRRGRPGGGGAQLLRVVLADDDHARQAWAGLRPSFDLDLVDGEARLLLPALGARLAALEVDDPAVPRLLGLGKRTWYTNNLLLSDLVAAVDALAAQRVPALAIRGAVTALGVYPRPENRVLRDVDLLVRPSDTARAVDTLASAGWARTLEAAQRGARRGVTVLTNADHRTLRLHDRLSPALTAGDDADLWARATTVDWHGCDVPAPPAEERLLQLCVDGVGSGDGALRFVADLVFTLRAGGFDRERFADLAARHRASRQAAAALARAEREFDAPVPPGLVERIASTPASRWERLAARLDPSHTPVGRVRRNLGRLAHTADRIGTRAAGRELFDRVARIPRRTSTHRVPDRSRRTRRANGRLVEAAVRSIHGVPDRRPLEELVRRADLHSLPQAAAYHHVVGHVHHALSDTRGVDRKTRVRLASLHLQAEQRHRRVMADLRLLHDVFATEAITWLVVKGPVLAEHLYPRNDLRVYNDLDVVVPSTQLADAVDALRKIGYDLTDRNWELVRDRFAAEVHLQRPAGAEIDLHWHLLFSAKLRSQYRIEIGDMIDRAVPVTVDGMEVLTFDPADTLIHLGLHAAMEGGNRLVWLADVDRAVAATPDWDQVVERARRWRVHLAVGTMLLRARRVLGTEIPREVIVQLVPNPFWRATLRVADRLFPPHTPSDHGNPATLVARSSRADVRSTLSTALSGLLHRGYRAASESTLERLDVRGNPNHPGSLQYARGGEKEFDEYLEAVGGVR